MYLCKLQKLDEDLRSELAAARKDLTDAGEVEELLRKENETAKAEAKLQKETGGLSPIQNGVALNPFYCNRKTFARAERGQDSV